MTSENLGKVKSQGTVTHLSTLEPSLADSPSTQAKPAEPLFHDAGS